ncbi:hypothetical protein GUITHDRAFT_149505, partial [Guillardia theta CCMP2712]
DCGSISRVMYEPAALDSHQKGWEMVTEKRDGIVITVFHTCEQIVEVQKFTHLVLNEFLTNYKKDSSSPSGLTCCLVVLAELGARRESVPDPRAKHDVREEEGYMMRRRVTEFYTVLTATCYN